MSKISCIAKGRLFSHLAGLAALLTLGVGSAAMAGGDQLLRTRQGGGIPFNSTHDSVLQIRANEALPQRRAIVVGLNKSVMVELPRELRDVIVSNPEFLDALVQSSNRVYMIGKKLGGANVFFFDANGEQVLILEVRVEADTAPLDAMLQKLLPGSAIKTEILNVSAPRTTWASIIRFRLTGVGSEGDASASVSRHSRAAGPRCRRV